MSWFKKAVNTVSSAVAPVAQAVTQAVAPVAQVFAPPDNSKERRETAHENWARSRDAVQYAFDRANDAGNYNANGQNLHAEIAQYKINAEAAATTAEQAATAAEAAYTDAKAKADAREIYANAEKKKIAETEEEEAGFDLIRDTALENSRNAGLAATAARTAATNARQKAVDIHHLYHDNAIQDLSYIKNEGIQKYQVIHSYLECGPPCNGGRGGMVHMENQADDVGSNILRDVIYATRDEVTNSMNNVKNHVENHGWPKRENARIKNEEAAAEKGIAESKKASAQSFLQAINDSADQVREFSNSHDYGWLTEQIDLIQSEINKVEIKRDNVDEPPYFRDFAIKQAYDASMVLYQKQLEAEAAINPFDAATNRLKELDGELKICTDATKKIEDDIKKKKEDIAVIAEQIRQKTPNVDIEKNKRDMRYSDMIRAKQTHEDLSGQLLKLQNDKYELEASLSEEEKRYGQLLQDSEKLKLDVIYWTQKNYSNKVYNSQNLLKLSENIDHNLQYIFSDLKTQNINPHLLQTKIEYRKVEEQKLTNTDKVLDVLFYCFYFSFILIIIVTRNANAEHFVFYIFIGLIPFLYPFLFKNANYLIHSFKLDGQKNAFIESDELDNENMFHAYNI